MKRFYLLALAASMLAACATSAPSGSPAVTHPAPNLSPLSPLPSPMASSAPTPARPNGRTAVFPNTIIVYHREGGFAGESREWTFYSTGRIVTGDGTEWQVPADQVKPLFDLAESPAFANLSDNYPAAGVCADCYAHTLTVFGPGKPQTVTFTDSADAPAQLQQILNEINRLIVR